MKAVFRYPGSKWSIAEWIISHFPEGYEKMVYLEPFLGSGAVFFNKQPGAVETIWMNYEPPAEQMEVDFG